jgi:hypothetical protein
VLNGRLELHGLDVEPFVARIVDGTLKRRNIVLAYHRREDLLAYAVAELWIASSKYDAGRYRSFARFADGVTRRKCVDWLRSDLGRTRWQFKDYTHQKARPQFVYVDHPDGAGELDRALIGEQGEFEIGRLDLRGLLAG